MIIIINTQAPAPASSCSLIKKKHSLQLLPKPQHETCHRENRRRDEDQGSLLLN